MRRALAITLLVLTCMALMALPAVAQDQRDPFEPQNGPGVVEPGTDGSEPGEVGPSNEPEVQPPPSDGGLGNTGMNPQPWLVLAYALVVFGIGAVAAGRVLNT